MERKYQVTGKAPKKAFTGQAEVIFKEMTENKDLSLTGTEWTARLNGKFATRQDPYRVVLYYLIIFRKNGLVNAVEQVAPIETEAQSVGDRDEQAGAEATDLENESLTEA